MSRSDQGDKLEELFERAKQAVEHGRNAFELSEDDVARARLCCYAFRTQTIGLFSAAAELARKNRPQDMDWHYMLPSALALQALGCLDVPTDHRAALGLLPAYLKLFDDLTAWITPLSIDWEEAAEYAAALERWREQLAARGGLWVARDDRVDSWQAYKVPGLEVRILPLVYMQRHSWNVAQLGPESVGRTFHFHRAGVEIHFGFSPLHGLTVLGNCAAEVREGYAMPIPSGVLHGFDTLREGTHLLPFTFGSTRFAGWGIFADVQPQSVRSSELRRVALDDPAMNGSVFIERVLRDAAANPSGERVVVIPATRTQSPGVGGLELSVRAARRTVPLTRPRDVIVSLRHGSATTRVGPVTCDVRAGDHWGVPANMEAELVPTGDGPAVWLEVELVP